MSREAQPSAEPTPLVAEDLPLSTLFQDLRAAGLPLGTADYLDFLHALRLGEGLTDRPALLRLCRLLWTSTREEARLLERLFERALPEAVPATGAATGTAAGTGTGAATGNASGAALEAATGAGAAAAPGAAIEAGAAAASGAATEAGAGAVPEPATGATPDPVTVAAIDPATVAAIDPATVAAIDPAAVAAPGPVTGVAAGAAFGAPTGAAPAPTSDTAPSMRGRALELAIATLSGAPAGNEPRALRRAAPGEYLPVSHRQMRQAWRRLRRMERRGPRTEPDLNATLSQIARDGIFIGPTLAARFTNAERLLLLIDRDGSMSPFQVIARRLVDTARRGGRLEHVDVCYFHNTPLELHDGLAVHPEGPASEVLVLRDLLAASPRASTAVLIFSDAGAARRTYSTERLEATRRFIVALHAHLRRVAWLNPVPRDRWPGTTAQAIRALVPMFEADRAGLDAALRLLRGRRPHPHGVP